MRAMQKTIMGLVGAGMLLGLVTCGSGSGSSSSSGSSGTSSGVASQLNPAVSRPTKYPVTSVEYHDSDAEGTISSSHHQTHDSAGNILTIKSDYSNDGDFDASYEMTYDGSGNLTRFVEDSDNNGSADDTYEGVYDEYNMLTSLVFTSGAEQDATTYTNTYDEEGRIIKQVVDHDGSMTEYTMQYGYREGYGYYRIESEWEVPTDYTNWSVSYWASEDLSERKTYTACHFDTSISLDVTCTKSEKTDYGDLDRETSLETSPETEIFEENLPPAIDELLSLTESLVNEMGSSSEVEIAEYAAEYDAFGNLIASATPGNDGGFQYIYMYVNSYADGSSTSYVDADVDGFPEGVDCDDNSSSILLPSEEVCDGLDNDCDGEVDEEGDGSYYYQDNDGDGYGDASAKKTACSPPEGYVTNDDDCDDTNSSVYDEDTKYYPDSDGDGYGHSSRYERACSCPEGYVSNSDDCDDDDVTAFPGAEEICDEIDNDCDGEEDEDVLRVFYRDSDGDGYGNSVAKKEACETPTAYVEDQTDCDDTDEAIHPGASDCERNGTYGGVPYGGELGIDDDCDGETDENTICPTGIFLQPLSMDQGPHFP